MARLAGAPTDARGVPLFAFCVCHACLLLLVMGVQVRKHGRCVHFLYKKREITLPRLARDKHDETQTRTVISQTDEVARADLPHRHHLAADLDPRCQLLR